MLALRLFLSRLYFELISCWFNFLMTINPPVAAFTNVHLAGTLVRPLHGQNDLSGTKNSRTDA